MLHHPCCPPSTSRAMRKYGVNYISPGLVFSARLSILRLESHQHIDQRTAQAARLVAISAGSSPAHWKRPLVNGMTSFRTSFVPPLSVKRQMNDEFGKNPISRRP